MAPSGGGWLIVESSLHVSYGLIRPKPELGMDIRYEIGGLARR